MNYNHTCHTSLNAQNADTSIAPYHSEDRLYIEVKRTDGLKASFSLPTDSLYDLLEHLTLVVNVLGYGYISGLEAIKHGEEND